MSMLEPVAYAAAGLYALAVFLLAIYGLHSLWLLNLFLRHRKAAQAQAEREAASPLPADHELPHVLVQLPVFNERDVVTRLVDAVGRLDWPKDRLHIQLLDDSTDDSVAIGVAACAGLSRLGLQAESIHRINRSGFKAGALENGLQRNDAPFVAIFDADFVPEPSFLRIAIKPLLADPGLALVQGRWEHLNRNDSLLTRAQSLGIDGHFAIEQGARAWSGLAMNFNGTCGLWRREAIHAAGGWEHDTLTEDMDLSYRAQLKGWRCTYRLGLAVPGEVPASVSAWRSQQFRWAKGSIQTAIKLLPSVWSSPWDLHRKLAATLHMTHYLVHPLILLSLFCAPMALTLVDSVPMWVLMLGLLGFVIGAIAPIAVYVASQFVLYGRSGLRNLTCLPALAAIGTGIAVSNATAVWQALIGKQSPFVRTPKQGQSTGSYRARAASGMPEIFCAAWAAMGLAVGARGAHLWITPLLALYFSGFLWMAWFSIRERRGGAPQRSGPSAMPALLPIGLLVVAASLALGTMDGSWRSEPVLFGGIGLAIGALCLAAVQAVRSRPVGRWVTAWIIIVALAARLGSLGLAPSDDVNRYILEGRQVAAGQNPYLVAPSDRSAKALVPNQVPAGTYAQINHPDWTAIYPPVSLAYHAVVTAFTTDPLGFKIAALICEMAALGLMIALLARLGLPTPWVVAAAWNPVGICFLAGEAHNESILVLLVAWSLYLLAGGHRRRSLFTASLATLAKPFAAPLVLVQLLDRRLLWWCLPPLLALAVYVPYLDAGSGLFSTMGNFGTQLHFHGAIEPFVRTLLAGIVEPAGLQPAVSAVLAALCLGLCAALVASHLRRGQDAETQSAMELTVRLIAVVLLCLPTLHAWYLAPLAIVLPLTRSWGLLLWTCMAPMYWLHALAFQGPTDFRELPLVTALAHVPAMTVLAWEALGRPFALRRPATLDLDDEAAQPATERA